LELNGKLVNHSSCKFDKSAGNQTGEYNYSAASYSYQPLNKKLKVTHYNAGFNCCPDSIYCEVNLINDTIHVIEYEESAQCNCDCLFDLNIEVSGVEAKSYFVKFTEPYLGDQTKLEFSVNFASDTTGLYSVTRTSYPWQEY
jgi:hypothetical protein